MPNRETKTITTPIEKHEVVIYTYLVGREKRALTNIYLTKDLKIDIESQNVGGIDSSLVDKAQDLAWQTVVLSIDGKKEGDISIVDTILNMRSEDYNYIVKAVNEVTADKSFEQKKTI